MEVTGDYDARNPDGSFNAAPRQEIAKEFFRLHKDEYDFLVIFTNFDFEMPAEEARAFYLGVRNDTQGIGQEIFDNSALYGSSGKLQGIVDMGNIANIETDPLDPGFEDTLATLGHEMLHRWAAHTRFIDEEGNAGTALLGKDGSHWSFLLDTDASVLYGNDWQDNGDGTFTSTGAGRYYSPLDLYLMGFYDKAEVPPMLLVDNPDIDPERLPETGVTINGTPRYITIDDIIAAEGERVPAAAESQKTFKTAFIYITRPDTFGVYEVYGIENIRNNWLTRFSVLTDGEGLMQVASTLIEDIPANPGVVLPPVEPRTLPPDINDGVAWLVNTQERDGSWTDLFQTTERDTAEAVIALKNFDVAEQSWSAGLQWLVSIRSGNMDYLSRKIEALADAGVDVEGLLYELVSRQNSDGGWGSNRTYKSNPVDTSFALKATAAAGYSEPTVISGAIEYLKSGQNADGGWGGDDKDSTVEATANVLSAFNAYREEYKLDEYIERGIAWLLQKQNSDGGFGNSPSTVYDTAVATLVLRELDVSTGVTNNALNYILGLQSEDGSWYESPYQTALAVAAVWKATVDPDLSVSAEDITFIPSSVTALPSDVVINAEIWNLGRTAVPQARVVLYEGAVSEENKLGEQVLAFPGQSSTTATFSVTVTDGNEHRFYIVLDPDEGVEESNEQNNTALKILYPEATYDFEIPPSGISVSAERVEIFEDVTISSKITNKGTMNAYNVQLKYYIDGPGEAFDIATVTVDIPAGTTITNEYTWRTNRAGDDLAVTVMADPFDSIAELSEENNRAVTYLSVNDATDPNLTVSYRDIVITPSPADELGNVNVSVIVRNEGFSVAPDFGVAFYKGVPGVDGVLLGVERIASLDAGGSTTLSFDWLNINDSGERIIYIRVDPDDSVREIKEDDNDAFTTLRIRSLPDLAISGNSISFDPPFPKDGDSVSITVTVQNRGEQEARDVLVEASGGDGWTGSQVIPSIPGMAQVDASFVYDTTGKAGVHEITVVVDPDNTVTEISEDNNQASRSFGVQDASLWLTEEYISPNGDGVKDSTEFFFRLGTAQAVRVVVRDDRGEVVRTFSGGELADTTGGSVTWDGLDDTGMVVRDGQYQLQVIDENNRISGSLVVVVDNNRSPLADAIGTEYLVNNNLTCSLPMTVSNWYWFPDERGILFILHGSDIAEYPDGVYTITPDGKDISRIIALNWAEDNPDYSYSGLQNYVSPDGEKIAFTFRKRNRDDGTETEELWGFDMEGQSLVLLDSFPLPEEGVHFAEWSPDGRYLAYSVHKDELNYDELRTVRYDGSGKRTLPLSGDYPYIWDIEWSPDSRRTATVIDVSDVNWNMFSELWISDIEGESYRAFSGKGISDVFYFEDFIYEFGWLDSQRIFFDEYLYSVTYDYGEGEQETFWIVEAGKGLEDTRIKDFLHGDYFMKVSLSPGGKFIAFVEPGEDSDYLKVSDMDGNILVQYDLKTSGLNGDILWSPEGARLSFITSSYTSGRFLLVIDVEDKSVSSFPLSSSGTLIRWLSDDVSVVISYYGSIHVINTESGQETSLVYDVTVPSKEQTVSPHGTFVTYYQGVDKGSICYDEERPYKSDLWAVSSLLDLTADLMVIKDKSSVILKGIAADLNLGGYMLEYAEAKNPDAWTLIAPPSDAPVVNDLFTAWVPPSEGTFHVRLTVWDKAGNEAVVRKRVSWGIYSSITNLYKRDEIFSPNGDGVKDGVELHYRVLEPVHLDFDIYDEDDNLVATLQKDYAYPVEDYVAWDGRDSKGDIVPDGEYRIKVFNYEFLVEVDNTPPDVSMKFEPIALKRFERLFGGEYYKYTAGLTGHVLDSNLDTWVVEYGEGDNPEEWFELRRGRTQVFGRDKYGNPLLDPVKDTEITSFEGADIGWLAGKRFKITAGDFAGNKSTSLSDMIEERVILSSWDGETIESRITDSLGLHRVGVIETVREELASIAVQYKKPGEEAWQEGPVLADPESYDITISWDISGLDPDAAYSVRLKAVDISGTEYYSNIVTLGHAFSIDMIDCYSFELEAINLVEDLTLLRFQIMSDDDPDYATWTDFRVYDASKGDVIPSGNFRVAMPGDLRRDTPYRIRMSGTSVSGRTYSSEKEFDCPSAPGVGGKVIYRLDIKRQGSQECDSPASDTIDLLASINYCIGPNGSFCAGLIDLTRESFNGITVETLTYYIEESPGTWKVLRSFDLSKEPAGPVTIDTAGRPEGTYPVKAVFEYIQYGAVVERSASGRFTVDRTPPVAGISYPDRSQMQCPLKVSDPGGEWQGIPVEGTATDNMEVKRYKLYYGVGEEPESWMAAKTRRYNDAKGVVEHVPIEGSGSVEGQIGIWDVTDLEGTVFSLKLEVTDIAGNVSCYRTTFSVDSFLEIAGMYTDKTLFSPNGDGVQDDLGISYGIDEYATVDVKVFRLTRNDDGSYTVDPTPVRTIDAGLPHLAGTENTSWDGRDDGGLVVPDGKYRIEVSATDPCGNTARKWLTVEVDNTPPTTMITSPQPGGSYGTVIEVRGTAGDPHFKGYRLEAGMGEDPVEWSALLEKATPVKEGILGTWNTSGLEGPWTLRLTAEDKAGNRSGQRVTMDIPVREDLVKELGVTPGVFSPNDDGSLDTTVVGYGLTDASEVKIEIVDSENMLRKTYTTTVPYAGAYTFRWDGRDDSGTTVPDGTYTVKLTAVLSSDSSVTQEEEVTLTVDTLPPVVDITQPESDSHIMTDVTVTGTIADENLLEYSVTCRDGTGSLPLDSASQSREDYTFGILDDLPEGEYAIIIEARDSGGNRTVREIPFTMDRTRPKVALHTPEDGAYYGNDRNVIVIAGGIIEENLDAYILRYGQGEEPREWTELLAGDSLPVEERLFEWKVGRDDGVPDGQYTLSLYARDKAGMEGEARVRVTVDNTPPEVSVTWPEEGGYVKEETDVKGSAFDLSLDDYTVEISEGDCRDAFKWAVIERGVDPVRDGVLTRWRVLPPDGDYCLRVRATDRTGQEAEAEVDVRVDTHPPSPPVLSGKVEEKSGARLSWTPNSETDIAGYILYRNTEKVGDELITGETYLDQGLEEGVYRYALKAVDHAGWESGPSKEVEIIIDLTGPDARIRLPEEGSKVSGLVEIRGNAYSPDDFKEYRIYAGPGVDPASWTLLRRSPLPVPYGLLAQWDTLGLEEGALYSIKIETEDIAGNTSSHQISVSIDNTPPASPVLISANAAGPDVTLEWEANTEPDLAGYLLFRNDQLANVQGIVTGDLRPYLITGTTYLDEGVPDGRFRYYLVAMDEAGNLSDQSNILEVEIDTRPPRADIVDPAEGRKFEERILVLAESPDIDIASIQFQYKGAEDADWINLGEGVTTQPYITYFDPGAQGLAYGDYDLRAEATDEGGKTDPSPPSIRVTYTDLTPPVAPLDLEALTKGGDVTLTWTANTEPDLDGYNVYRRSGEAWVKVNAETVRDTTYADGGLPDGTYEYEITATDRYGNESPPSGSVSARIYAPLIEQPYTPTGRNVIQINGSNAEARSTAEVFVDSGSGPLSQGTTLSDAEGNFAFSVSLVPGENRITVKVVDSRGSTSRISDEAVVVYNEAPAAPTGLTTSVEDYDVTLTWDPNTETDLSGYNLYSDGVRLNAPVAVTSGATTAYPNIYYAWRAFDSDPSTYWYAYASVDPLWWEIDLPEPELISRLRILWGSGTDYQGNEVLYAGRDYEVQVWSGYAWITQEKVTGNSTGENVFDFSPSYRTDKIRIFITDITSREVRLAEVEIQKDNLTTGTSHELAGLDDGEYTYTVTAVDYYGFESPPSEEAGTIVGDIIPPSAPEGLTAVASGADVILEWTANPEPDLAGYRIYRQTTEGWSEVDETPATDLTHTDAGLPNGTYTYRITAVDRAGNESPPSTEASATVDIEPPLPPMNLSVVPVPEGGALGASWDYAGEPGAGYNLYRSTTSGGPYIRVNTGLIAEESYLDAGLTNGIAYYYVVTAVDSLGNESVHSNESAAVPADRVAPSAPEISFPALPGGPVILYKDRTAVAGMAEPGAGVEIFKKGSAVCSTTALAEDVLRDIPSGYYNEGISLSDDGDTLAYFAGEVLWLMDIDTGEKRQTVKSGYGPLWSPDGGKIAYIHSWTYRIIIYDVDREVSYSLTDESDPDVYEFGMSWSAAGDRMAFVSNSGGDYNVWLKDFTSGTLTQVTEGLDVDYGEISPEGDKIAYVDGETLYVRDLVNGETLEVDPKVDSYSLDWSPESRRLAFVSYRNGDADIYVLDTETMAQVQITDSQGDDLDPSWSPDGQKIVFVRTEPDWSRSVRIVDSGTLSEEVLAGDLGTINYLAWVKAGKIAYAQRNSLITAELKGQFRCYDVELDPGENTLYAVAVDPSGNTSLPSGEISVLFETSRLPDLETTAGDIYIYPPAPVAGDEVTINVVVWNRGYVDVKDVDVDVYLWGAEGDLELLTSGKIASIGADSGGIIAVDLDSKDRLGTNSVIVVVDPEDEIQEVLETNNYAVREFHVSEDEGVSLTVTLDREQYHGGQDVNIDLSLKNSGIERSVVLEVWIEDGDGNEVALLERTSADLSYASSRDYSLLWNTGSTYAGDYRVRAVAGDASTGVAAEEIVPFVILPDIDIESTVVTDKSHYGPGEDVAVGFSVGNNGRNSILPLLKARLRIRDSDGRELHAEERDIVNLLPGGAATMNSTWNTALNAPGEYMVIADVYLEGEPVSSASTVFRIDAVVTVTGDIKVSPSYVPAGESVTAEYTVRNSGNTGAACLVMDISVTDPETGATMSSYRETTDLDMGGVHTGRTIFSSKGYGLKTYVVLLQYTYEGDTGRIGSASFTVRDGTPPVVDVISPESGRYYNSAFDMTVVAEDDASGVDYVEYRTDGGPWKLLPLADPSSGRYTTAWLPVKADEGPHTVDFRATDKAGNTGAPVSTAIAIDLTAPEPPLITSPADGSFVPSNRVDIKGVAEPGSVVEMGFAKVFRTEADPVTGEFIFSDVGLIPGKNTFVFTAEDAAGNMSEPRGYALYLGKLEVTKSVSRALRTLVLIGDDPGTKQTRDFIENALIGLGAVYKVVGSTEDFYAGFRSGIYNSYILVDLVGHEFCKGRDTRECADCYSIHLHDDLQAELREAVHRGEGLVFIKTSSSGLPSLDEALGVVFKGKTEKRDDLIITLETEITGSGSLGFSGYAARVVTTAGASAGIYESTGNPAIVMNTYGLGKSVLFTFNPVDVDDRPEITGIFENALGYVNPGLSEFLPLDTAGVDITLAARYADFDVQVVEQVAEGLTIVGISGDPAVDGKTITWQEHLVGDTSMVFRYLLRLSDSPSLYTLTSRVYYLADGSYTLYKEEDLTLAVETDPEGLTAGIIEALSALEVSSRDGSLISKAVGLFEDILRRPVTDSDGAERNIRDILQAIEFLREVESVDVSDIRTDTDRLLRIWEVRWSLFAAQEG